MFWDVHHSTRPKGMFTRVPGLGKKSPPNVASCAPLQPAIIGKGFVAKHWVNPVFAMVDKSAGCFAPKIAR